MVTAVVAGLAAVAVVVVQQRMDETGEQASGGDPQLVSAMRAAFEVEADARAAEPADFGTWADWETHFRRECDRLGLLYSGAGVEVVHNNFNGATGGGPFDAAAAAVADDGPPASGKAQVQCVVG